MYYRKYRPKNFKEVIGQEIIVRILKNIVKKGEILHGYLFAGERGTGKTTLARIFAKAINCLNPQDGEACENCKICKLWNEGKFLDLIEIDAASHRKIDDVRNLQEHIGFKPLQGKYKVFIIDEAHMLTEEAFNALLKTLEEPPKHVVFILATTEPNKIPPTILSRLQRLDFKRISLPQIVEKIKRILENEKISYEEPALYLIAEEAEGSLRDAETLLEKIAISLNSQGGISQDYVAEFLGQISTKRLLDFLNYLVEKKTENALSFLHEIYKNGYELSAFLRSLIKLVKEIIFIKVHKDFAKHLISEKPKEIVELMEEISQKTDLESLKKLLKILFEADSLLRKEPPHPLLPLEIAVIEFTTLK
jgi:DNA polymerase-3 subunit gamma/tau